MSTTTPGFSTLGAICLPSSDSDDDSGSSVSDDARDEPDWTYELSEIHKSQTIPYPIRSNYVERDWDSADAFRELVQNWYVSCL